jgi:hypothetical protein
MAWLKWPRWLVATEQPKEASPEAPDACYDDDVLAQVVLAAVKKTLRGYSSIDTGFPGDLEREEREIARLRAWYETIPNRRVRNEYERWCNYHQRGVNDARAELINEKRKREAREYEEKNRKLWDGVYACQASGSIPTPPERP